MALEQPEEEGVEEILRKKLALAVKSIQWSYAIFWSISSTQPAGVLKWSDGYYNGDIKTRKTVLSVQVDADQQGLHRTEQLRELYKSLVDAETNPQSTRPSAALSPEDLTDAEWYFLVCMSFEFNIGQGLPGRTLANNETIWLLNAHYADSKVFSRSLLAMSASVQTVVCFPYSGGVIELGTTELVSEDPNMIQHITSHLETPRTSVSKICKHISEATRNEKDTDHYVGLDQDVLDTNLNPATRNEKDTDHYVGLDQDVLDTNLNPEMEWEEVNTYSTSNNSSEGFEPNHEVKKSQMDEGINGGASQVQSWQFMDDEISNGVLNSVSSSDCVSQTFASPQNLVPLPNEEKGNDDRLPDLENCKDTELTSEIRNEYIQYQSIVSTILKSSHQLILGPCFQSSMKVSSFVRWKNNRLLRSQKPRSGGASQRLLKKVLYEVAKMHGGCLLESQEDNGSGGKLRKPKADETYANRVLAERRRRAKIHEKFVILGSMVPSTGKVDKVSLLDDTIEYLKNLKNRVEELESQKEVQDIEARRRRKSLDFVERTSDNYGAKRIRNNKKRVMNKRKAFDVNEMEALNLVQLEDNFTDVVTVSEIEKNVVIEVKCPWREDLLLEIMDAISNLHLDSHSVQSSKIDGNLSLTVKSKVKGSTMASVKMMRQALQRVTRKC